MRASDACVVYRACGLLPAFVDGLWMGYGRENGGQSRKFFSLEICRPYMNLEGLKTAFNYYMEL